MESNPRRPRRENPTPTGVTVVPDPPVAGQEVEVHVENGADELLWSIPPGGEDHSVSIEDGVARFRVPAGASQILIIAGDPPNLVSDEFDVVSTARPE